MGRSQKWPDLRSPISKIQDIRFVGTDDLIIFQKFHNFPWNIVAVARWKSYFVVGSLDLTWWPDLTWPWAEIFTKVAEKMGVRWVKTRRRCVPPFFRYPRKTWGGGAFKRPPPAGRGLKHCRNLTTGLLDFFHLTFNIDVNFLYDFGSKKKTKNKNKNKHDCHSAGMHQCYLFPKNREG